MPRMTQAEYLAFLARAPSRVAHIDRNAADDEAELHEAIRAECARREWIPLHGSMAHKTYRTIGESDFCCLLPKGLVLFVECKTKTGKLSLHQLAMQAHMRKLGHQMHVVRSFAEFLRLIDGIKQDTESKSASASVGLPPSSLTAQPMENVSGCANATAGNSGVSLAPSLDVELHNPAVCQDAESAPHTDFQSAVRLTFDGGA